MEKQEERFVYDGLYPIYGGYYKGESKILQTFDNTALVVRTDGMYWREVRLKIGETSQKTTAIERRKLERA